MNTTMLLPGLLDVIRQYAAEPGFFAPPAPALVNLKSVSLAQVTPTAATSHVLCQSLPLESVKVLKGTDTFAESRVAVVAQWSVKGEVPPYVVYALRALKEQGYAVILACGGEPVVRTGWLALCSALVWRSCPGYDFTSWKAVFQVFPSLYAAHEVLLTNDSVFMPVRSLYPVHAAMDALPCDFWGLVESREKQPHLQSYYLVFRQRALQHPAFAAFWDEVGMTSHKMDVVLRHEVTLSPRLAAAGLVAAAYVPAHLLPQGNVNPAHYFWRQLIEVHGVPFIKRDVVRQCHSHPWLAGWQDVVRQGGYEPKLILEQFGSL